MHKLRHNEIKISFLDKRWNDILTPHVLIWEWIPAFAGKTRRTPEPTIKSVFPAQAGIHQQAQCQFKRESFAGMIKKETVTPIAKRDDGYFPQAL